MNSTRLAILLTHPIQYYTPLLRALALEPGLTPRVFYTLSTAGEAPRFDPEFGAEIKWDIPLLGGYQHEFAANPALIPAIEAWRPDALLVFGWNANSHLHAMRHFKGRLPVFFRGDSTLLDPLPGWRRLARKIALRWVFRHIDVAIAVGQNNSDYFRWCGVPASRIAVAPHSVDNARFFDTTGASDAQALRWRSDLGIPRDALVFTFAAKFIEKKAPLLLLETFRELDRAAHLVYVGSGPLEQSLRSRAQGCPNIHFLPFKNQLAMPAVYRLGDVYVLPSGGPGETWGLALNEAMASGRAVIAGSRAGAARDLIVPAVNGWVFESGDRRALAQSLKNAADAGVLRLRQMGRDARHRIGAWSTEAAATRIAEAVRRFAPAPAPPP